MHGPLTRVAMATMVASLITAGCGDGSGPRPITADLVLTEVNGSAPPGLVYGTLTCDVFLDSGDLSLLADRSFSLSTGLTTDCTREGGSITTDVLAVNGTYNRGSQTITFNVGGGAALTGTFDGTTISGTIPASPQTFPVPIAVEFTRVAP